MPETREFSLDADYPRPTEAYVVGLQEADKPLRPFGVGYLGGLAVFWPNAPLSQRQRECIAYTMIGHHNHQTSRALGISEDTVKTHLKRSFEDFGIAKRHQLVDACFRPGNRIMNVFARANADALPHLDPEEEDLATYLGRGFSIAEISEEFSVERKEVKNWQTNLRRKLGTGQSEVLALLSVFAGFTAKAEATEKQNRVAIRSYYTRKAASSNARIAINLPPLIPTAFAETLPSDSPPPEPAPLPAFG